MPVWFALPSKRPPAEVVPLLTQWRSLGYRILVQRDPGEGFEAAGMQVVERPYRGYYEAGNYLCRQVLAQDERAEWIVTAGDDTQPDPHRAEQIGAECTAHFQGTFGVMQPCGDRWGEGLRPKAGEAHIDTICGSPWIGADFCRRAYGGRGPFWPAFYHMFGDQELQEVALSLGVLWQRRDLIHMHDHWQRTGKAMPAFLAAVNRPDHWDTARTLFYARKEAGFPGHEAIA